MLTRVSILGLALTVAAGAAVAGTPAPAQASKSHAEKKTCVQRSTTGHCEKWAAPAKSDSAVKAKEKKTN